MEKINFDRGWRFFFGDADRARWGKLDVSDWREVDLPHDWSIELPRRAENPSGTSGGYFEMGRGWYCKNIVLPPEWQGQPVWVEFEGVYMNATVWLNEHLLTRHPYGYTSFHLDLTPYLSSEHENILKVFVDNSHQLNSRWYSGSGIYRHVWLLLGAPLQVQPWGVFVQTPQVSPTAAQVAVSTRLARRAGAAQAAWLRTRVISPEGQCVAEAAVAVPQTGAGEVELLQELTVAQPHLWSPDSPLLYQLESVVELDGQAVDRCVTPFGVRWLEFSAAQGFRLNGQALKLKGGCVHHDHGVLGAAAYDRAEERKVEIHKASGYNAIRCAHNPPSPAFLDACDRLGMLVIDEAFDCWREGKNPGDYHVAFESWWQRDVDSMVRRDRNHPCIILWSIGNEIMERDGRNGGVEIAHQLAERVRSLDGSRPVTAAICGVWDEHRTWQDTAAVFAELGVGGYNYQLRQYRSDHELYPERMIIGTESTAMEAFDHWMAVEELLYVLGDFIWTSLDYLGESGIGRVRLESEKNFLGSYPWHQANCGDLDLCGFKRPQSYYRDILWKTGSPLYIGVQPLVKDGPATVVTYWGWPDVQASWTWPGQAGSAMSVAVYSACDAVELFLNGSSLGIQPSGRQQRFTAIFEVPFAPGELKAVGLTAGVPAAEMTLRTAGAPARLRLAPDRAHLRAGVQDLSYVTVELVDAGGVVVPAADVPVSFSLAGGGVLAAVGSADPTSPEAYRGSQRSTFRGRCLAVVQAGDLPGEVHLQAAAPGLPPAELVLTVG